MGKTTPHKSTLKKLANALGVPLKELLAIEKLPEVKFRKNEELATYEKDQITHTAHSKAKKVIEIHKSLSISIPSINQEILNRFNKYKTISEQSLFLGSQNQHETDYASFLEDLGCLLIPVKARELSWSLYPL